MEELIAKLMRACGLGEVQGDLVPVSGGLMHRMFKVTTDAGVYAVKALNPDVMCRPGVRENFARAEELERLLEARGLPVVAALSFGGQKMLEIDGRFFYVFKWLKGCITDWNSISVEQCYKAGNVLGRIHSVDWQVDGTQGGDGQNAADEDTCRTASCGGPTQEMEQETIDFEAYLSLARAKGSGIASQIEETLPVLIAAQDEYLDAQSAMPHVRAIIDDDMDPKNVMWHDGEPFVIDLECLENGNPVASCLNLALQWAGIVNEKYDKANLLAFFEGYRAALDGDLGEKQQSENSAFRDGKSADNSGCQDAISADRSAFRGYDKIYGVAYSAWLGWLEYNIRRALGLEGSAADVALGKDEVVRTLARIRYLAEMKDEICAALRELD